MESRYLGDRDKRPSNHFPKKATQPGETGKSRTCKEEKVRRRNQGMEKCVCVCVLARKYSNKTPETKEPKETRLHHSEQTCQSAAQASRVKEPHSGCSTHWEVSKNSGLNKNARASPTNRPNPPNRQKKNQQKEKAETRGAEGPDSAETPCPFPGGIPFPCARTRARRRTWTPGAGGRRR